MVKTSASHQRDIVGQGVLASREYRDFIADLKSRIQSARISAARAVNSEVILLYWDIGQGIVRKQQELGWGDSVVELVAADLRREFPGATGFSAQNVWRMRQLYLLHTQADFLSQVVREIKKSGRPAPSDKVLSQVVREMVSAVPWGHHANALKDEKTDANGDKAVSFSEAAAAVQDKVKTLSGGNQRPITRGVNREAEVALASFGPPVAPIPAKEKKSGLWPF
jgi:hypothetical protein